MAHPPDCSLSFNQIRAKFAGSSTVCEAKSSRSEPTLETEENGKEEEDAMDNVVAMRKSNHFLILSFLGNEKFNSIFRKKKIG